MIQEIHAYKYIEIFKYMIVSKAKDTVLYSDDESIED